MARTTPDWLVATDPTDTFTHRLFRSYDLQQSAQDCTWPEGIRFANRVTGEQLVFHRGQLKRLETRIGEARR